LGEEAVARATGVPPQGTVTELDRFSLWFNGYRSPRSTIESPKGGVNRMSILWIILIVILVLALLGFFSRGRW
jgi:hypothetical protein